MQLKFLAHSSFLITSDKGTTLLTDPYEAGGFDGQMGYQPIDEKTDVITISHHHADHNYIADHHRQATVFDRAGKFHFDDVALCGVEAFHDQRFGLDRGKVIIFTMEIDGITFCHLGDLGHALDAPLLKIIGKVDVLCIPVGGIYTLDADAATTVWKSLAPKICIPMHYKTEKLGFTLAPVTDFTQNKSDVKNIPAASLTLQKNDLPKTTEIFVLKHAK